MIQCNLIGKALYKIARIEVPLRADSLALSGCGFESHHWIQMFVVTQYATKIRLKCGCFSLPSKRLINGCGLNEVCIYE